MSNNLITRIKASAGAMLIELGFNPITINGSSVYEHKNRCLKFVFVDGLQGFVIEFAESFEEAQNNVYEDGDLYPISLGEKQIIALLREDMKRYYLDN